MTKVEFTVIGHAKGKARPRMTRRGRVFTPQGTINYENLVKISYQNECGEVYLEGALACKIDIYHKIPKSMSKKNRLLIAEGKLHCEKTPDLDNVAKSVLDALNGCCFNDDRQVVELHVYRYYSDHPRVDVLLEELE